MIERESEFGGEGVNEGTSEHAGGRHVPFACGSRAARAAHEPLARRSHARCCSVLYHFQLSLAEFGPICSRFNRFRPVLVRSRFAII